MNGRKAKALRRIAHETATKPTRLGYIERKIPYASVDKKGRPKTKYRRAIELRYHPQSARAIYRRMKLAYKRSPEFRALMAGR